MGFLDAIRSEAARLNRIRFVMNYVLVPAYLLLSLGGILVGGILMSIDEQRYESTFIGILIAFVLLSVVFLASVPFVRRREIRIELRRYGFDASSIAPGDEAFTCIFDEELTAVFDRHGVRLNDCDLAYHHFFISVVASNPANHVLVQLEFRLKREQPVPLPADATLASFAVLLRKELIWMFRQGFIRIENPEVLDHILEHPTDAFTQIYKYGRVKTIR